MTCCIARAAVGLAGLGLITTAVTADDSTWTGAFDTDWNDPLNWTTDAFPNNGNGADFYDVFIGAPSPTALNVSVTIATLTITPDGLIETIGSNKTLTIDGGVIDNDGMIRLIDVGSGITQLRIDGDVTLDGTGSVVFASTDDNHITSVNALDLLTIGANQTITTTADTIFNNSEFQAAAFNLGVIEANGGQLELQIHGKTNQGVIRAVGGGTLEIEDITIDNVAGTLLADTDSTVLSDDAIILGGLLTGAGTFEVNPTLTLDNAVIDAGATVSLTGSSKTLRAVGTLTNNGTIFISEAGSNINQLLIDADVLLDGAGTVLLASVDDNRINSVEPANVLTIGGDQTVTTTDETTTGNSMINAAVINLGLIEANGGDVELRENDKVNESTIQAVNGGLLEIEQITVTNTGATIRADTDSTIQFDGATVIGGTLTGTGVFDVASQATLVGTGEPVLLDAGSTMVLNGSSRTANVFGTFINDGTISINEVGGGVNALRINGDVMLDGSGSIVFVSTDDNRITSIDPADLLTIGSDQTLTTSDVTNISNTMIVAATRNLGLIEARAGELELTTNDKVNEGVIQAVDGGLVLLDGITVTNAGGEIIAGAESSVSLANSAIVGGQLSGAGTFNVTSGQATFDGSGAEPFTLAPGATVTIPTSRSVRLLGDVVLDGTTILTDTSSGAADLRIDGGGAPLTVNGTGLVTVGTTTDDDHYIEGVTSEDALVIGEDLTIEAPLDETLRLALDTQNTGTVRIDGLLRLEGIELENIDDGVVTGNGTVLPVGDGSFVNSGRLAPGSSTGTLTFDGDFAQLSLGRYIIELGGRGDADLLAVNGTANLSGRAQVVLLDGYDPVPGEMFTILTAEDVVGAFLGPCDGYTFTYTDTEVILTIGADVVVGDLNCDGAVDGTDLGILLGEWGQAGSFADINGDGLVDGADLGLLLGNWTI